MIELNRQQIDEITQLVAEASSDSLQWFRDLRHGADTSGDGDAGRVENKSSRLDDYDPVTEADRAVEQRLRTALSELFPDHAVVGEEFGTTGTGPHRWFIDPIDGTRAFVCGLPVWGTLVGLTYDGRPVAGWMHLPVLAESYVGSTMTSHVVFHRRAEGECRRIDLQTSETVALEDSVLLCTHPSMFAPGLERQRFQRLADRVKMVRYGGDCMNYGLLATGEVDLVVENQLAIHDIVPLIPIVTGAGGTVTDPAGDPPMNGGYVIAAANHVLHGATLAELGFGPPATT